MSQSPRTRTLSVTAGAVGAAIAIATPLVAGGAVAATPESRSTSAATNTTTWKRVFDDEFSGTSINHKKWVIYQQGQRRASNVIVKDGHLILRTQRTSKGWTAAGVGNSRGLVQTYGRYVIRARLDRGYGTKAVALLWPTGGTWPPEIDFLEVPATVPDRSKTYLTNHYSSKNRMQQTVHHAGYSAWHLISVTWGPQSIVYQVDGHTVAVQSGHSPSHRMWLGLQTAVGKGKAAPNSSTPNHVDFVVDYVRIYHKV